MRTIFGALYGGLVALLIVLVIDILISEPALGVDGGEVPWADGFRPILDFGGVGVGALIGAWRGWKRDRARRAARHPQLD